MAVAAGETFNPQKTPHFQHHLWLLSYILYGRKAPYAITKGFGREAMGITDLAIPLLARSATLRPG